ncbi:hypothetical protein [Paracoccus marcusii]|uniref:hypothetical protein n=1 Tax=Paracoccus marcusii TaxID=59779 RepID=UPI0024920F06|nr:hypothetical protein [Paracoccus marcusii]
MTRTLSCGPARLVLEGDHLRHLHLDGVEAIRGLSFLVRDRDWGTVVPRIDDLRLSDGPDGPRITWTARYDMGTGSVRAALTVDLTPDGLTARAVIGAEGQVWTNRTGFTLLHPITGVAGAPVTVDHAGGPPEQARFPALIAPWQPFMDITGLTHQAGGWSVHCRFDGDIFEMEDQRQWGDASFKTYNRPLAQPWPYRLEGKTTQTVTIRWSPAAPMAPVPGPQTRVAEPRFPQTALALTGADAAHLARAPQDLAAIGAQRLLCHLDAAGDIARDLAGFAALQAALPGPAYDLELLALCDPQVDPQEEFARHAAALAASGLVAATVLVHARPDRQSTPPGSDWPPCAPLAQVHAAARAAFVGHPVGGGVASFFPELNRKPPPPGLAVVTHGLCPIVHAADDLSVVEALEAVPHILASGRALAGDTEYWLGPSTIAMRHNPYGSRTIPNPGRGRVCMTDDDPRQETGFAAAWACGLAAAIAPADLSVWTPAEVLGPRGLFAPDGRPRPVAGVVAALAALAGAPVHDARGGDLVRLHLGGRVLRANLTPRAQAGLAPWGWDQDDAPDLQAGAGRPKPWA